MRVWVAFGLMSVLCASMGLAQGTKSLHYNSVIAITITDLHSYGPEAVGVIRTIERMARDPAHKNTLILIIDQGDLVAADQLTLNEPRYGQTTLEMFSELLSRYSNLRWIGPMDNHSFDKRLQAGLAYWEKRRAFGPILSANFDWQGRIDTDDILYIDPYHPLTFLKDKRPLAITGFVTPLLTNESLLLSSEGIFPRNVMDVFSEMVADIRAPLQGVKTLIVASHLGQGGQYPGDDDLLRWLKERFEVDAGFLPDMQSILIITGHDHAGSDIAKELDATHYLREFHARRPEGGTVVLRNVESEAYGRGLGLIEFDLSPASGEMSITRVVPHIPVEPLSNTRDFVRGEQVPAARAALRRYSSLVRSVDPLLSEVITQVPVRIVGENRKVVRVHPGAGVAGPGALTYYYAMLSHPAIVRDVEDIKRHVQAQVPATQQEGISARYKVGLMNATASRNDLPTGQIRRRDLYRALTYSYNNGFTLVAVKGRVIRQACEEAAIIKSKGDPFWMQFVGVDFVADYRPGATGHRVGEIRVWGRPLEEDSVYLVGLDDFYRKQGNDIYAFGDSSNLLFVRDSILQSSVLIEWFFQNHFSIPHDSVVQNIQTFLREHEFPLEKLGIPTDFLDTPNFKVDVVRHMDVDDIEWVSDRHVVIHDQGIYYFSQEMSQLMIAMSAIRAYIMQEALNALKPLMNRPEDVPRELLPFAIESGWFQKEISAGVKAGKLEEALSVVQAYEERVMNVMAQMLSHALSRPEVLGSHFPAGVYGIRRLQKLVARSGIDHIDVIYSAWRRRMAQLTYGVAGLSGGFHRLKSLLPALHRERMSSISSKPISEGNGRAALKKVKGKKRRRDTDCSI